MATEEEKNNQKELNQLRREQEEQLKQIKSLTSSILGDSSAYVDTIKETLGIQSNRATFDSNLLKINKQINTALYNSRQEFTSQRDLSKEIAKNQDVLNNANKVSEGLEVSLGKKAKERAEDILKISESEKNLREEIVRKLENGEKVTEKELQLQKYLQNRLDAKLEVSRKAGKFAEQQYIFTKLNARELERTNEGLKEQQSGTLSFLNSFFAKIPGFSEASSKAFKSTSTALKGGQIAGKGFVKSLRIAGKFAGFLGKALYKALGPLGIFGKLAFDIVQALFKGENQIVELSKTVGLAGDNAYAFRNQLSLSILSANDLFVTSTKVLDNFTSLNKQFGFITTFSNETLINMTKLTEKVGLAKEAAGGLAASSELNNISLKEGTENVLGTSYALQRSSGVAFDLRQILDATGRISGGLRASLAANPELLAEAVTQAKLLGGEIEDVAAIASSLLDFETSISNELQASLLTGKSLNFETARYAALYDDVGTVAKEVSKQIGNFSEFSKLSVISQDAVAKSIGLSRDRLSDILFQQALQNKNERELLDLTDKELAARLERTSSQQKLNAVTDKYLDLLVDVGAAVAPIAELFGAVLSIVGALVGAFRDVGKAIRTFFTTDAGFFESMNMVLKEGSSFYKSLDGIGGAFGLNFGLEQWAKDDATKQLNEINNPQIKSTPTGTSNITPIQRTPQTSTVQPTTNVNVDTDGLKKQVMMQTKVLEKILNKEGTVQIDSSKVGRAFTVGTSQIQ